MFFCFHVSLRGLWWCGWVLWLVVLAIVYRCDIMCKLHTRGCVGCQIRLAGCVSIGEYVTQLTLLVWGWASWVARSKGCLGIVRRWDCCVCERSVCKIVHMLLVQDGQEITVHPENTHLRLNINLNWFESLTYALVTCPVDPYVHRDAGHTNGCASMSSVTNVGAFLE